MKKYMRVLVDVPEPSEDDLVIDFGDRAILAVMALMIPFSFALGGMML